MTFNQTSSIRFSVEESVWFKKGQEVSDLIGISLEPEISVQEHDNYILIRGALVLSGEYRPQTGDAEDESNAIPDSAIYRIVDEVIENDDGNLAMKHRFPIDITIPTKRIRSLEEVYVLVESFDYETSETGRLDLKADLCISGIANERAASLAAKRQNTVEHEEQSVYEPQEVREEVREEVRGGARGIPLPSEIPVEQDIRGELGVQPDQEVQTDQSVDDDEEAIEARQASLNVPPEIPQPPSLIEATTTNDGLGSAFRQKLFDTFKKTQVESEEEEANTFPSFTTEIRKQGTENEAAEAENAADTLDAPIAAERAAVNLTLVSKPVPNQNEVVDVDQVDQLGSDERPIAAEAAAEDSLEAEVVTEAAVEAAVEEAVEEAAIPVNIVAKRSPQIGMKGRSERQEQGWNPKGLYGTRQATYNTSGVKANVAEEVENEDEQQQRSRRTENALYLTKMLSSEGEADFSKLRLRIVQNGETLGTIAKAYDISTNQIIRLNGLDDEIIKEGQILYIPAYAGVEK
ncbi:MAG TPA: stage VI sporulation protein D [Bacillales bacterium]|nr:stage VI sporulation protein D [Bacillales bacterium]